MIGSAAQDLWSARRDALMRTARAARDRRRVEAIDEMLDILEHMHLNRERTIDRLIRTRLRRLEDEVGLPLPRKVVRARNTVRLHAALLDWQDVVLDEVVPGRRELLDHDAAMETGDEEPDTAPRSLPALLPRAVPAALPAAWLQSA